MNLAKMDSARNELQSGLCKNRSSLVKRSLGLMKRRKEETPQKVINEKEDIVIEQEEAIYPLNTLPQSLAQSPRTIGLEFQFREDSGQRNLSPPSGISSSFVQFGGYENFGISMNRGLVEISSAPSSTLLSIFAQNDRTEIAILPGKIVVHLAGFEYQAVRGTGIVAVYKQQSVVYLEKNAHACAQVVLQVDQLPLWIKLRANSEMWVLHADGGPHGMRPFQVLQ